MKTNEKKEILKKHYSLDEICEILGLNNLFTNAQFTNESSDWDEFEDKILDQAIINGNFEECIEKDCRFGL